MIFFSFAGIWWHLPEMIWSYIEGKVHRMWKWKGTSLVREQITLCKRLWQNMSSSVSWKKNRIKCLATNWFVTLSQKPCHRTDMVETMQENNWLLTSEAITPQSSSLVTWKRSITALVYNSEQQVMVWYEKTSTSASFAIHIWIYSDIGWDWKKSTFTIQDIIIIL